jgi:hypothetical protein
MEEVVENSSYLIEYENYVNFYNRRGDFLKKINKELDEIDIYNLPRINAMIDPQTKGSIQISSINFYLDSYCVNSSKKRINAQLMDKNENIVLEIKNYIGLDLSKEELIRLYSVKFHELIDFNYIAKNNIKIIWPWYGSICSIL